MGNSRPYWGTINQWFLLIRPAIRAGYFLGGKRGLGGVPLDCHDWKKTHMRGGCDQQWPGGRVWKYLCRARGPWSWRVAFYVTLVFQSYLVRIGVWTHVHTSEEVWPLGGPNTYSSRYLEDFGRLGWASRVEFLEKSLKRPPFAGDFWFFMGLHGLC